MTKESPFKWLRNDLAATKTNNKQKKYPVLNYNIAFVLMQHTLNLWKQTFSTGREHMFPFILFTLVFCSSIQFSSVVSDSLQAHGLQHARLPCPLPTPRPCSNSCPLSQWCHPTTFILCHSLLLLPSIFLSIFSSESVLHIRWPKY